MTEKSKTKEKLLEELTRLRAEVAELKVAQKRDTRTKDSLSENERNLREVQRLARIGNWQVDLISGKIHWSEEMYRILRVDPNEDLKLAELMRRLLHPDDRERMEQATQEAMETGVLPLQ